MAKKLIWIESLNANDSILGHGMPMGPFFNPFTEINFQKQLKIALGKDWEVNYISQDINKLNEIDADVIVVSENLKGYINVNQLKNAIIIPFLDIKQKNYSSIKTSIQNASKNIAKE